MDLYSIDSANLISLTYFFSRARVMVWWIKCLLSKHKSQSVDPLNSLKSQVGIS